MGNKNKGNISNHYNIANVNMEIDYDKLAEAIVKANNMPQQEQQPVKTSDKIKWKEVVQLIFSTEKFYKSNKMNGNLALLSAPLILTYKFITVFLILLGLASLFISLMNILMNIKSFLKFPNYIIIPFFIFIAVLCAVFQSVFRMAAKEVEETNDIQILSAIFSSVVTFIAMAGTVISVFVALWLGGKI